MTNGRSKLAIALSLLAVAVTACGGSDLGTNSDSPAASSIAVAAAPPSVEVVPLGTVAFQASVTGTVDTAVTWTVVEATGGTINSSGLYTAPSSTGTFHVIARSVANPSVYSTAVVVVTAAPVIVISLSPSSASVRTSGSVAFSATVTGTSDTAVVWSVRESSGCGSVTQGGVYTAPPAAATCHVVVTSHADPARAVTGTVAVTSETPPPPSKASCASEPLRTSNVHYFCDCQAGADPSCGAGNDANDGLTPAKAKRSFSAAHTLLQTMAAGHTVAFCRGGKWTGATGGGSYVRNPNCTAANTCDFRDYGSTTLPRPILDGTGTTTNMFLMGWFRNYTNFTKGYRFLNLDIRNTPAMVWYIDGSVQDMEVCNVNLQDTSGEAIHTSTNSTCKRINFHHSTLTRVGTSFRANGMLFACDDCAVDSNVFDYTGGPSYFAHALYVGSNPESCGAAGAACNEPVTGGSGIYSRTQRMRITNNKFTHSTPANGACVGVVIVVHEPHDDLLIENNHIYEPPSPEAGGCYGIGIGNGMDEPGAWRRAVIRRNQIYNTGYESLSIENCQDCDIDSNLIVSSYETYAIKVPRHPYTTGVGPNLLNSRTRVRNNTMYYTSTQPHTGGIGISVGTEGTGYVVTNNSIFYNANTAQAGWECFRMDLPAGNYTDRSGNACYSNVTDNGSFKSYISANPLFTNATNDPATANFTPTAGSPLVGAGSRTYFATPAIGAIPWSPFDTGVSRGSAPDVGAYQR